MNNCAEMTRLALIQGAIAGTIGYIFFPEELVVERFLCLFVIAHNFLVFISTFRKSKKEEDNAPQ